MAEWLGMIKWEGCERKYMLPILKYYSNINVDELNNTKNNLSTANFCTKIQTQNLLNTK